MASIPMPAVSKHPIKLTSFWPKIPTYLQRVYKYKHMDFEYAFWQMCNLFYSPSKVFKQFHFTKQTKSHWARDDPAFLVLLCLSLCFSSIAFALVLRLSFMGFLKFVLYVIFIDCIGTGLVIATLFWALYNKYKPTEGVEWAYGFDVHLNAFVPLLLILHVFLLCLYKLVCQPYIISALIGNLFWVLGLGYYIYITFLGYSVVSPSRMSIFILYAMLPVCFIFLISIPLNWNFTVWLYSFYSHRVG